MMDGSFPGCQYRSEMYANAVQKNHDNTFSKEDYSMVTLDKRDIRHSLIFVGDDVD